MKLRKILLFLLMLSGMTSMAQIGIQTNSPDASAALDIVSTNKGLLIPRVTLTSNLSSPSPVTSPATGLLVFNTGANQTVGLYFWDGSKWNLFNAGSTSSDYWGLSGNAGTTVGTNFLGTTDNQDMAVYTNNSERMRVMADGRVVIGATAPTYASDLFTAIGNSTQNYAINAYSDYVGVYANSNTYGVYADAGTLAFYGIVDNNAGYPAYMINNAASSYGAMSSGSGIGGFTLNSHYFGLSAHGSDGVFTVGHDASAGIGIVAGGNNVGTLATIATGTGGAFTGNDGSYSKGTSSTGTGVIGVGNNGANYYTTSNGSGGGFGGSDGVYGYATNTSSGIGVIGVANNGSIITTGNSLGGSFNGYHGVFTKGTNTTYGTGVIGVGNNASSYYTFNDGSGHYGSGGAFTGAGCGVAGYATRNNNNSVGVYGYWSGTTRNGMGVKGVASANSNRGYGVYGQGNKYGVYANGNLGASGTKSFVIDDPRDPENKILKHYSIESNEVLNMYRGVVVLNSNGEAQVTLPDYFTTININYSYTLTSIGVQSPNLYIKNEIDDNGQFTIGGGKPNQKVSWVVYADRNDPYMQKYRNRETDVVDKTEDEKGKYLMPELYNQPPEKGIFYDANMSATSHGVIETPGKVIKSKEVKRKKVTLNQPDIKDKKIIRHSK